MKISIVIPRYNAGRKIVSERLREELAQFDQWTTREVYIGSSPNIKASYELVDEYLKSRDSHDTIR